MNTTDILRTYLLRDDGGSEETIQAKSLDEACERAEEWTREGDWDTSNGTVFVTVYIEGVTRDESLHATFSIDPPEPRCLDKTNHDWQSPHEVVGGLTENPGVWSHGGGIVSTEVCAHCARYRKYDTWAQNPSTGEQGLESTTYEEADEDSQAWVDSQQEIEYSWNDRGSLNDGECFLICEAEQGSREASALWVVTAEECEFSENDSDEALDEDGWPEPPTDAIASAREWLPQ